MAGSRQNQAPACSTGNGASEQVQQAAVEQHLHAKTTSLAPPVLGLTLPLLLDQVVQGHVDAPWHLLQEGCRAESSIVCLQDCLLVHDAPACP